MFRAMRMPWWPRQTVAAPEPEVAVPPEPDGLKTLRDRLAASPTLAELNELAATAAQLHQLDTLRGPLLAQVTARTSEALVAIRGEEPEKRIPYALADDALDRVGAVLTDLKQTLIQLGYGDDFDHSPDPVRTTVKEIRNRLAEAALLQTLDNDDRFEAALDPAPLSRAVHEAATAALLRASTERSFPNNRPVITDVERHPDRYEVTIAGFFRILSLGQPIVDQVALAKVTVPRADGAKPSVRLVREHGPFLLIF